MENWLEEVKKLGLLDQRKVLGVAFIPVMNHLNETEEETSKFVKEIEEFCGKSDVEICTVAFNAYKDETMKFHGDIMVTESLNYFSELSGAWYKLAYDDSEAIND